jgi:hypothetical protein
MDLIVPDQKEDDPTNCYTKVTIKLKEGISDEQFGEGGFVAFFNKHKAMSPIPVSLTYADGAYTFGTSTASPPGVIPEFIEELVSKIPSNQAAEFCF